MNPTEPARRRWWLLAAAMLAVSMAGFAQVMNRGSSPGGGDTPPPQRDEPRQVISLGHADVDGGVRKIYPLQPGRVAELLVREGDTVAAGTPLFRIEDKVGRLRVDEAKAAVEAAEAELVEARKRPELHRANVERQKIAVNAAKIKVATLQFALEKKKELQAKGVGGVSSIEVETTQGELNAAELAVQAEDWQLRVLSIQDPLAEARLLELKVAVAKARLEQAKAASDEYTITAPIAGTVLRLLVGRGDTLAGTPLQPAIELAPDAPLIVRAEVEQAYASRVEEGQIARILDDAHAGGSWTGRVAHVSDWYTHRRSIVHEPRQFNDVRTLECKITLDPGQPKLRIGQRVRVFIQTTR